MLLEGSCHCGAVRFSLESHEAIPYQHCYCGICRKTQGGGGSLVNLGGDAASLRVEGREHVRVYQALIERDGQRVKSQHERHFCGACGSHLWAFNQHWPHLVHPVASAIDTPLPVPPARVHMMIEFRPSWIDLEVGQAVAGSPQDECFAGYPALSLADWHRARGVAS